MTFSERLHLPWWWWLVGLLFVGGVAIAVLAYVPPAVGIATCVLAAGGAVALLASYGSASVVVDDTGLRVGRNNVTPEYLGAATAYEGEAARQALGPGADPHAFLFTRPFLTSVVRVDLHDPADPHPYWLISTRRPQELAAALEEVRSA
ncbi:MAG: DUF3093 domain-containing protein [Tessaracoccus sp.]|uniref:DUF3093 domain-containing protein n=1 Tax=Tessaracoccus sp. TaxID=1971211 RepID=UPI001EBF26D6|nr:DUF3093 domain-containing protein [Tessaracoccus sp.]MBK7820324.1 DUF3093 domain-containing protein [Tessaracoccus sp.]